MLHLTAGSVDEKHGIGNSYDHVELLLFKETSDQLVSLGDRATTFLVMAVEMAMAI